MQDIRLNILLPRAGAFVFNTTQAEPTPNEGKYFPVPKQGEMMQKFISYDDFTYWHLEEKSITVSGFIAKTEYSALPKNAEELVEMSRLDYINTPFAKNKKYVLLRWKTEAGDNIIHPFQRSTMPTNELPYTNTGMTGSQYSLIPEYHVGLEAGERMVLNTAFRKGEAEAIVYNADGSIFKRYKLIGNEATTDIEWKEK